MTRNSGRLQAALTDIAALMALKGAIGAYVLWHGFSHVSDDDYARTVIAEQFAHAPALDPSGTSWLPLPFWLLGTAMLALGRSLAVARSVAVGLGVVSVAAPYAALRAIGVGRASSTIATGAAMALPWSAWLGVATVPESWTGALCAAGILAMSQARLRPMCAFALLLASLCRYETWPACAALASLSLWRAARPRPSDAGRASRHRELACTAVALLGPASWMIWNAHAHGDALHFLARVSAFRRAHGAAAVPLVQKLLGYPSALVTETPEAAVLAALATGALVASRAYRARWTASALATAAVLVFLIAGDVRDGAPTHHPERALSALWWVLMAAGVDAIAHAFRTLPERGRRPAAALLGGSLLAFVLSLPGRFGTSPGTSTWDRREAQIARGLELRSRQVASVEITPCAFEHFALIAAWGRPEDALVHPSTNSPPTAECPQVVER